MISLPMNMLDYDALVLFREGIAGPVEWYRDPAASTVNRPRLGPDLPS